MLLDAKTKTDRRIPILPALAKVLKRRRVAPDGNDFPPTTYVFGSEVGELLHRRRFIDGWRQACRAAEVSI